MFHTVNQRIESGFQLAMADKAARDQLMDGQTLKMSKTTIDQAARGLTNTSEQVALGRAVDDMYGRYSKFSPANRQIVTLYTPFAAWMLSAVTFLTRVLPRDHPVLTSLLVSANHATNEWRKAHGLDKFIAGRVPDWLQGSLPTADGGHQRFPNRYTPFSLAGDPLGSGADAILPQFSGVLNAARGTDWKGTLLRDPDGQPVDDVGKLQAMGKSFLESTIPVLAQGERVAVGDGTLKQRLAKELNPGAVVKGKAPASGVVVDSSSSTEAGREWCHLCSGASRARRGAPGASWIVASADGSTRARGDAPGTWRGVPGADGPARACVHARRGRRVSQDVPPV